MSLGRTRAVVLVGVVVTLLLAGLVSSYASASPDGLNRVAMDEGFDRGEKPHALDDSPLAGYELAGVGGDRIAVGLAGIAGVGICFLLGSALGAAVRRPDDDSDEQDSRGAPARAGRAAP